MNVIQQATSQLDDDELLCSSECAKSVLNLLSNIVFDEDIEVDDPRDIRDNIIKFISETSKLKSQTLLSKIYSQLKLIVTSDLAPEDLIKFFQETVHVEFLTDGCVNLNLYEYTLELNNQTPNWYAAVACFLSAMCVDLSEVICYPLLRITKPGTDDRIQSLFKVVTLLYDIQPHIIPTQEYQFDLPVPPISPEPEEPVESEEPAEPEEPNNLKNIEKRRRRRRSKSRKTKRLHRSTVCISELKNVE